MTVCVTCNGESGWRDAGLMAKILRFVSMQTLMKMNVVGLPHAIPYNQANAVRPEQHMLASGAADTSRWQARDAATALTATVTRATLVRTDNEPANHTGTTTLWQLLDTATTPALHAGNQ